MPEIILGVGTEDFTSLRRSGSYYVDKTELIYELVQRKNNTVTLFTRPRRFGKTLTISMLESFFAIDRDSRELFAGLNIAAHEAFCQEWMNQYPVLTLSLKGVEGSDFTSAYNLLQAKLADLCKKVLYLQDSEKVNPADREIFRRLLYRMAEQVDVQSSLKALTRMMYEHFGRPVILLIDEYDVPLSAASEHGYYDAMLAIIRSMFESSLKTNEYLRFAVITGCLRIAKESVFTGANNFVSYSVRNDEFSSYFGFLRPEVEALLSAAGHEDRAELIQAWYDGYMFGDSEVYCPWDVVSYVSALNGQRDAVPQNYWKNTSHNGILRSFVEHTEYAVNQKFEKLMNGGVISTVISEELTYDRIHSSEENLWSVLLMTGYLTVVPADAAGEVRSDVVRLRIPNREIETIFEDTVVSWFRETVDGTKQRELFGALWSGDAARAERILTDFLWKTISYHDYHEDYYHAFLAGIFAGAGYYTESNREHGLGRTDLVVVDQNSRSVLLIEAKKAASREQMERACLEASVQIRDNQYYREYVDDYTILCYAIAFYKKYAVIRKLSDQI